VSDPAPPAGLLGLALAAGLVVGILRTSVGGGIGLVLTPVLGLLLPLPFVLGLTAALLSASDPIALRMYWGVWDARRVRLLLPGMLAGILLGGALLGGLPDYWLRKLIGATALVFAAAQAAALFGRWRLPAARGERLLAGGVGLASGVASSVAHSGGIIMSPYLAGLGLSNAAVIGTGSALVTFSNTLKLATYGAIGFVTWRVLGLALLAVPGLYAGAWLGYRLNRWLPRRWFALALLLIAGAGALRLLMA
jgi:hypothetical protein